MSRWTPAAAVGLRRRGRARARSGRARLRAVARPCACGAVDARANDSRAAASEAARAAAAGIGREVARRRDSTAQSSCESRTRARAPRSSTRRSRSSSSTKPGSSSERARPLAPTRCSDTSHTSLPGASTLFVSDAIASSATPHAARVTATVRLSPAPRVQLAVRGAQLRSSPFGSVADGTLVVGSGGGRPRRVLIQAVVRRRGDVVAAGTRVARVPRRGRAVPFEIQLIGDPKGGELRVWAPPA